MVALQRVQIIRDILDTGQIPHSLILVIHSDQDLFFTVLATTSFNLIKTYNE